MKTLRILCAIWLALQLSAWAEHTLQKTAELAEQARQNIHRIQAHEKNASYPFLGHRLRLLPGAIDDVRADSHVRLTNGRKIMDDILALYPKAEGNADGLEALDKRLGDLLTEIHRAEHR